MVERQFTTKLKSVQTDWGGEFRPLTSFFTSLGIIHRRSCPHTSEQNGTVERRHRHVVETGLALLAQSHAPQRYWHFAFDTAVYLINRLPSSVSFNKTPFENVFHRSPDYRFLRVFGCQCFPYLRPYNHHKMTFRSTSCVFLGYSPSHHGYRCLDHTTDRVYIARHVRFNEEIFPFAPPKSQPQVIPSNPYHSSVSSSLPTSDSFSQSHNVPSLHSPTPAQTIPTTPTPPPSTSPRPVTPTQNTLNNMAPIQPTRTRPPNLRPNPKRKLPFDPSSNHVTVSPTDPIEPVSFTVANTVREWRNAMSAEYLALLKNGTWTLVPPVHNANIIDCKWLYRIKRDSTGKITRYKARLVAKGFRQQPGVDYHETFSPVIKSTTIRVVLSLAVTHNWTLRQLDVQNAFLHGDLQEKVYLRQPPGFVDPTKPDHICLLHKSLYGLKQAPRAWFHRLSTTLHTLGFVGSKTDPSLFILKHRETTIYVLVYVDDIIVTGNNTHAINDIISKLGSAFAIKDLGNLHYFLGIEVTSHGRNLLLSQRRYIHELLQKFGLSDCKPVNSPMSTSTTLALNDSPLFTTPSRYRQLVGALQYVTLSRPDITFAVNKVCQYMHAPTENHWAAVKRIMRYLKGTSEHGLLIRHDSGGTLHAFTDVHWQDTPSQPIKAFSDSDWAGCLDDRRSTGGFAIYLGSNLISWTARKQRTVSRSSTESEYKAIADTVSELTWLQALLRELGVP